MKCCTKIQGDETILDIAMSEKTLGEVKYSLDHENRFFYVERYDDLTKDKVYAEWEAMQKIEGFDPGYETIADYSRVSRVDLSAPDLIELNKEMPNHDPRTGNVAIVSGLTDGRYYLGKFFCTMANQFHKRKHQIFQTRIEAELWLYSLREKNK